MSSSPEAIIYYGFPLPDFDDDGDRSEDQNHEWNQEKRPEEPADHSDYKTPEWDVWREKFRAWEASPENIRIEWSGGESYEAYYVHAKGLSHSVEWSEHKPLAGVDFGPQPAADEQLRLFCDRYGIEWTKPGWHLATRYF